MSAIPPKLSSPVQRSFASRTAITVVTNLLLSLIGFLSGMILARVLGPESRGELAAIQLTSTIWAPISLLGVADALVYYCSRYPHQSSSWLASGMSTTIFSALLFSLALYVGMPYLLRSQPDSVVYAARVFLIVLYLDATVGLLTHTVRGSGSIVDWNLMRLLSAFMWLVVVSINWYKGGMTSESLAYGYVIGYFALSVPLILISRRSIVGAFQVDRRKWKPLLKYGLSSVFAFVPMTLNLRLDQALMAASMPSHLLGVYVVAVSWSSILIPIVVGGVAGVLMPYVAAIGVDKDRGVAKIKDAVQLTVFFIIPATAIFISVTPFFLPFLFGREYITAVPISIILTIAAAVQGTNTVIESGIRGLGFPIDVMYAELAGLMVAVVLLFLLLGPYQLMGAAVASLISYSLILVILMLQLKQRTGLNITTFLRPSRVALQAYIRRLPLQ